MILQRMWGETVFSGTTSSHGEKNEVNTVISGWRARPSAPHAPSPPMGYWSKKTMFVKDEMVACRGHDMGLKSSFTNMKMPVSQVFQFV
jgi:hypothetical protein